MRRKSLTLVSDFPNLSRCSRLRIRFAVGFALGTVMTASLLTTSLLILSFALSPDPVLGASGLDISSKVKNNPKAVGEFRRDLKAFIKQSKEREDHTVRHGAIVNLCLLHEQIVRDSRFPTNDQLKGFRAIAADRLNKCRKQIELELLREERARKKTEQADYETDEGNLFDESKSHSELRFEKYNSWLIEDMQLITQLSGGPVNLWKYTGNHAGPLCDYGPDLVRLIESTINPEFWRSNGGTGVIEYYQPLRILVISASSKVHDDLSDLLRTIRANGR